jgi:hypothetical protein
MSPDPDLPSLIRDINRTWLENRVPDMRRWIHPDIVMAPPGFGAPIIGREAFLQSFEEFLRPAAVREFQESEIEAGVWGSTAVATFRFDVTYELEGKEYREAGREIWVFSRDGESWLAVWRTQLSI